jgi:hypothetical protein
MLYQQSDLVNDVWVGARMVGPKDLKKLYRLSYPVSGS